MTDTPGEHPEPHADLDTRPRCFMSWKKGRSFIVFTRLVRSPFSSEERAATVSMLQMGLTAFYTLARMSTAASLKPSDKSPAFPLYLVRPSISEVWQRSQLHKQ